MDKRMEQLMKKGKKVDPLVKEAKMNVLKDLSKQSGQAMMVKISSDSKEGLKQGLEIAKDKIEQMSDDEDLEDESAAKKDCGCPESEDCDCSEMDGAGKDDDYGMFNDKVEDFSNVNPEDLDKQIENLMKLREKMKTATMKY